MSRWLCFSIHRKNRLNSLPDLSNQGKDRLNSLPDELLQHILFYLPTKDAVATTLISKRWKSLWRSQTNLCFDDKTFLHPISFCQFLHSFFAKRDNTLPIHTFHVNTALYYHKTNFYAFVYDAITRGVQNLSIDLHWDFRYRESFPAFVLITKTLSTKTLSVLKLKNIAFNELSYEDDPCFDLPSLKVLHLGSVTFTFYKHIRKLLSACPILEELEAKNLVVERLAKETIDVPSLSNLVRANISAGHIGLDWLHNVRHLRIKLQQVNPLLGMFHNLIYMELRFDYSYPSGFKWGRLIKLLQNSPKLRTMIIDEGDREWKDPEIVPECLLSHLTTCSLGNYRHANCEFQFAKYIMQNSKVLRTMTIHIAKSVESGTKIQKMCKELSLCPMNSATCKLLFI